MVALVGAVALRSHAQEAPETGFMVQPVARGDVLTVAYTGSDHVIGGPVVAPALRLGYMLRPLSISGEVGYTGFLFRGSMSPLHSLTFGANAAPYVWSRGDQQLRAYVIGGFNVGVAMAPDPTAGVQTYFTGGFTLGGGLHYFLKPTLAVGVEAGLQTQFVHSDFDTDATTNLYIALTATWIKGHDPSDDVTHPPPTTQTRPPFTTTDDPEPEHHPSTGGSDDLSHPVDKCPCEDEDDDDDGEDEDDGDCAADPVYFNNGQAFLHRVDLAVRGRGEANFVWARVYKSYVRYDGPLGFGWTHRYDARLERTGDGGLRWLNGHGRAETFTRQADGSWRAPVGFFVRLDGADGQPSIARPDGKRYLFNALSAARAPGMLAAIEDRHGNRLRFVYGESGVETDRLVRVVDPYDRTFTIRYDATGRIASVTDDLGQRTVRYRYSVRGDLIRATSPALVKTTFGSELDGDEQAPDGNSEIYVYTHGVNARASHKLWLLIGPNQARGVDERRLTDGQYLRRLARLENTWNIDPGSPDFGRVIAQRWGSAPGAAAAAGGTLKFEYGRTGRTDEVSFARIRDRNGNLTELFHNAAGQVVRARQWANRKIRPRGDGPGQDPEFFETTHRYDADGLRVATRLPMGNQLLYKYDSRNSDRRAQGNLIERSIVPDARGDSRGGQQPRTLRFQYEPIYQQVSAVVDERGNDATYVPQTGGAASPARYTWRYVFDYQQSTDRAAVLASLAARTGRDSAELSSALLAAGVALGLGDQNDDPSDDGGAAGDVVRTVAPTVTPPSWQKRATAIVTEYNYDAHGQLTRVIDPERNVHRYVYHPSFDPDGDGVRVPDTTQTETGGGWLAEEHLDAAADPRRESGANPTPVDATTRYFYDALGDVIRRVDRRGVEHRYEYDALGRMVRKLAATSVAGALLPRDRQLEALAYETRWSYDADGNLVATRTGNQGERDGTGAPSAANRYWTTRRGYDLLDRLTTVVREVEPIADDSAVQPGAHGVTVTRFEYDANQNLTAMVKPEGERIEMSYDERNLRLATVRAAGTPLASRRTVHYDLNGAARFLVDAAKNNPSKRPEFSGGDVTELHRDGFDRVLCAEDAESGCGETVFDPSGRVVRFRRNGPREEGAPRLAEEAWLYDEAGRLVRYDRDVFRYDASAALPFDRRMPTITDGPRAGEQRASTLFEYDALGRLLRVVDPKLDEHQVEYDGASRIVRWRGPKFGEAGQAAVVRNESTWSYDGAGDRLRAVEIDRSPGAGETRYTTDFVYDAAGRLIRTTDPAGQTTRTLYDSRGNAIVSTDARSSQSIPDPLALRDGLAAINAHGNVTRRYFDGLSRLVRVERDLRDGGAGDGDAHASGDAAGRAGVIATGLEWDRDTRVTARIDPNGRRTAYHRDLLGRADRVVFADGSVEQRRFDLDDNLIETVDPNGVSVRRAYDGLGRLVRMEVPGARAGTSWQAFEYDGLSRLRIAADDNGDAAHAGAATEVTWDSLSRRLAERHRIGARVAAPQVGTTNGRVVVEAIAGTIDRTVTSGYAPARPEQVTPVRTSLGYPTAQRTLTFAVDGIDRIQSISDGATSIAGYSYVGARVRRLALGDGSVTAFDYDADRRLTGVSHKSRRGALVAGFAYGYDGVGDQTSEQRLHAPGQPTDRRDYDSVGRVVAAAGARYQLDGAHNFVKRSDTGGVTSFTTDELDRYRAVDTVDASGRSIASEHPGYDAAGAQLTRGDRRLTFDGFDRLIRVERTFDGGATWRVAGVYTYDALGRRVTRAASFYDSHGATAGGEQVALISDGPRELEEVALGDGSLRADYVWGERYVDEPIQMRRGGARYYYHAADQFSTAALTDDGGAVVERVDYRSPYGAAQVTDAAGAPRPRSAELGNPFRFQGRRFDPESGLYDFRRRALDPELGRFVNRDPIGMWGDRESFGNPYAFVADRPTAALDPYGTDGYATPGEEQVQQGTFTRSEYEKFMTGGKGFGGRYKWPDRRLIAPGQMSRGCVGLCRIRQNDPFTNENYPEDAASTDCYWTLEEALATKCRDCDKLFVFAKQGKWAGIGPMPGPDQRKGSADPSDIDGPFNYATHFSDATGDIWEFMDSNLEDATKAGNEQHVFVRRTLPTSKEATIYCAQCLPTDATIDKLKAAFPKGIRSPFCGTFNFTR